MHRPPNLENRRDLPTKAYAPTNQTDMQNLSTKPLENIPPKKRTLLDLFGISATGKKPKLKSPPKCENNSPYIFVPGHTQQGTGEIKDAKLFQACCNDWTCERCGEMRARHEYGRIIEGVRELKKAGSVYMLTITARGDVSVQDTEENFGAWCKKLNDKIRITAQRKKQSKVAYVEVLERQNRGHIHAHRLTNYCPHDAYYILENYDRYLADIELLNQLIPENMRYTPLTEAQIKKQKHPHNQMHSNWLALSCVDAGLGVQCRIALCEEIEGAARYVAKYMFKTLRETKLPKKTKRVRYSQGWWDYPEAETEGAFAILWSDDWYSVVASGEDVECYGMKPLKAAKNNLVKRAYLKLSYRIKLRKVDPKRKILYSAIWH